MFLPILSSTSSYRRVTADLSRSLESRCQVECMVRSLWKGCGHRSLVSSCHCSWGLGSHCCHCQTNKDKNVVRPSLRRILFSLTSAFDFDEFMDSLKISGFSVAESSKDSLVAKGRNWLNTFRCWPASCRIGDSWAAAFLRCRFLAFANLESYILSINDYLLDC